MPVGSLTLLPVAVPGRQYTVGDGVTWSFVCVSVFSAIKEVPKMFVETADVKHSAFDMLV